MSVLLKTVYNELNKNTYSDFFKCMEDAQVIIFHANTKTPLYAEKDFEQETIDEDANLILKQPLPFKSQWIELVYPLMVAHENHAFICRAVLITERSPEAYKVFSVGEIVNPYGEPKFKRFVIGSTVPILNKEKTQLENFLVTESLNAANVVLTAINHQPEYGVSKADFVLKKGVGKFAYRNHINKIIHIRAKTTSEKISYGGQEIDWSDRWRVRGHWRKISAVGKDRNGDYGVQGFTWVVEHVKGPEELPIVEKTRIVHNFSEARA